MTDHAGVRVPREAIVPDMDHEARVWADYLSDREMAQVRRAENGIKLAREERKRLLNRAYTRMARDRERGTAIRAINERIAAE